jgi:NAD(P)-dependent dehydrogenase (short-subunit alcohol dehydrogenase family)
MAAGSEFPRFDLSGQVVLVTAAARGLGRACALACAHAGADIALGLRDKKSGEALVAAIQKFGRKALPLQMDMTRIDEIASAVDEAERHFG